MKRTMLGTVFAWCAVSGGMAQDTVKYMGSAQANVDYHHGQLMPAVGVHNIQVFRANREFPDRAGSHAFTYNHQPFLACWNGTYYLQFLSNPVGEHIGEGKTLLLTSTDGYVWSGPTELFPPYPVPEGFAKPSRPEKAGKSLYAVMHQRMGFFVSNNGKLLAIGYYGVALDAKDDPNDGNGIGRVVREIKPDGSFGPIYFIRFNAAFDQEDAQYPPYGESPDRAFVAACEELLDSPLMMQQWAEEADRDDPLVPYKRPLKAFAYYHLDDGRVVGLWKHALTSISRDGGRTWAYDPLRAPGFVNGNAKIWGQRTSDGRYAAVYNPSEFRWPLAVSTSEDGLTYTDLLLVSGEIPAMRYGGNDKSYGPQYVRGIQEGNGLPPDGNMWVAYSMNKEDIWVAKIPVPVTARVRGNVSDNFAKGGTAAYGRWNIHSPLWAKVELENGILVLRDADPYDYAKAERIIEAAGKVRIAFTVIPRQTEDGILEIEFANEKGQAAGRLTFDRDGLLKNKSGYRNTAVQPYKAGEPCQITLLADVSTRSYRLFVNGADKGTKLFFQPVDRIGKVSFRTGSVRRHPDADTPTDQDLDAKASGIPVKEAAFGIAWFEAERINRQN